MNKSETLLVFGELYIAVVLVLLCHPVFQTQCRDENDQSDAFAVMAGVLELWRFICIAMAAAINIYSLR
ncbi:hypothetical protein L4174_000740 [Photobacterium sp. CCB-ST2H9]|uniref:hypothetical protein n=1 Tax=Photobacterium sp. CCB-ST2H9 TaxID=2912855 RepID=UPI002005E61F|nr:hypothetical protein [Photobacterium sp. CCB-ST2H9]UTM57458.1 hypothetical protein L4174_000740 [Photobacterium sp. CCB-ST2H9]